MYYYKDIQYNLRGRPSGSKIKYMPFVGGFDIETTKVIHDGNSHSFMYVWQFGITTDARIVYGRTWDELKDMLDTMAEKLNLSKWRRMVVYVHYLGYEFQFMRKLFKWQEVFSVDERKPIKALTTSGIEFRDSLILSGMSLETLGKNLLKPIPKLKGYLDYDVVRSRYTELTEDEYRYCENDIQIILQYIREQIDIYGHVRHIPMTNTGRVRDLIKRKCLVSNSFKKKMQSLTMDIELYEICKRAFMGGFVHSSHIHTFKTLKKVGSYDLTSAYPFAMVCERFPSSQPKLEDDIEVIREYIKNKYKGCVFECTYTGLKNKIGYESYISKSKCYNMKNDNTINGRVYSADELTITITDIDYKIIKEVYSYESMSIGICYTYDMQYLPKELILAILDLYEKKTTLKDVEGQEVEYMLSKGMINSVYGMEVTDIIRDMIEYDDCDGWTKEKPSYNEMSKQLEKYNNHEKRTSYYIHGIYVTAYTRRTVWNAILNLGSDYIYSDTDSCKFLNYEEHQSYFENYNKIVLKKIEEISKFYNIPIEKFKPKNKKGVEKIIGIWDFEGVYNTFKTLGAKRYLVEQDGDFKLTCAGLGKKQGMQYIYDSCNGDSEKIFQFFNSSMEIPPNGTGKKTHKYIDTDACIQITDYQGNKDIAYIPSCVTLEPCAFSIKKSDNFIRAIEQIASGYVEPKHKKTYNIV